MKPLVDDEGLRAMKKEKDILETKLTIAERNYKSALDKSSSLEASFRGSESQVVSLQRQLEKTKADLAKVR
jgi:multidrug resistance efflux pump